MLTIDRGGDPHAVQRALEGEDRGIAAFEGSCGAVPKDGAKRGISAEPEPVGVGLRSVRVWAVL